MKLSVGSLVLLAVAHAAFGDAQSDFDELFGDAIQRVSASRNSARGVALAKQMVEVADSLKGNTELKVLLWTRAAGFSEKTPTGYDTAVKALKHLIAAVPDQSAVWSHKLLTIYNRRYLAARRKDKRAAGDEYIEQIMAVADMQTKASQASQAVVTYRKALAIATSLRSARKTEILGKIKSLTAAATMQRKIETARSAMKKDPDDIKARQTVVKLYLLELDKPAEAAKLLNEDSDERLRTYIPLAAGKVEAVDKTVCFEMGQWYWSMFPTAETPGGKATVLRRTKSYLERFRSLHDKKDVAGLHAATILAKVDKEASKLGPGALGVAATPVAGAVMRLGFDKSAMFRQAGRTYCRDLSGKGNHGRMMMGAAWTSRGLGGGGCLLDGNDDYVDCGSGASLTVPGPMTISMWINLTGWENGGGLCTKGVGQGGESYLLDMSGSQVRFVRRPVSGSYSVVTSARSLEKGKWHHVVAIAEGKKLRLYVNTAESVGRSFSGPAKSNTHIVSLGSRQSGQGPYDANLAGIIDEVAIFPRALTPEEVKKLYDQHKREAKLK